MKKASLAAILITLFVIGMVASAPAVLIEVTATADNLVGAWYQNGATPVGIALPVSTTLNAWGTADTFSVDLVPCEIKQLIFHVINDDNDAGYRLPSSSNPGGFLAEMNGQYLDQSGSYMGTDLSSLLSDSTWEVARYDGPATSGSGNPYPIPVTDFAWSALTWVDATEVAPNDGSNIWTPVSGISAGANWIWTEQNFGDSGAPDVDDSVFFRVTMHPVPEPGTLFLLGTGLIGIAGYSGLRSRRRKKR